ncbi:MAG: hypothetical protein EWV92_07865 [Microcystis aeruginosa Ma_MB_S_20031200_S102]|uniref:Uncharacterized protein n=1 Tax=Microcystis aeruginosa Ma_MB_S_20031200_S102 TaxID=2486254 RepID=A0A552EWD8_MICAE|nr:MAG: hypothetical protein EWV79_02810 [Microcystis aeruginosa Ma_MB_S_20031200_S102D]TRU38759.1 MAG: hypothetical protein EWV92_07865 [Microcystis aeruginosa Ma_MB_S_20031200_S102]
MTKSLKFLPNKVFRFIQQTLIINFCQGVQSDRRIIARISLIVRNLVVLPNLHCRKFLKLPLCIARL